MYKKLKKKIKLYNKKNELLRKKKENKLDMASYILFEKLGFSVKYDKEKNLYLMDNIHNKRMYTNLMKRKNTIYRRAENEFYLIEFGVCDNRIISFKLYEKQLGKEDPYVLTHIYKKEDK